MPTYLSIMKQLPIILLILFSIRSSAQQVSCQVFDQATSKGLSYVNIGVPGKGIGTVSDFYGNFSLKDQRIQVDDTIRFSAIGYQSRDMVFSALLEYCEQGSIPLTAIDYELPTVEVIPRDYKMKKVGNHMDNQSVQAGFMNNLLGHEIGTRMKIRRKPAYIEKIHININVCEFDSIFYRLNIYDMEKGKPGAILLHEPIYLSYSKKEALAGIVLDVSDRYIRVEDDFFVSVELVRDLGEKGLMFSAGLFADKGFYRKTSQDRWQKVPLTVGIAIGATILQEK